MRDLARSLLRRGKARALPRGGTGKILKNQVREKYWQGYEGRVH